MNPHTGGPPESEVMVDRAQRWKFAWQQAISSTHSTHHAGVACSDMVRVTCAPWCIGGEPPERRVKEAPLPRRSPRNPAGVSQFPEGLLHIAFPKMFRCDA